MCARGCSHSARLPPSKGSCFTTFGQLNLLDEGGNAEDEPNQLMAVSIPNKGTWTKITATVDSGAVDHVFPEDCFPGVKLQPSELSKAGRGYVSATSEAIPNLGEKKVGVKTSEGQRRSLKVQVARVRKPLLSAAKLNEGGNTVILSETNPRVVNERTGEITKLKRIGRSFLLDLWSFTPGSTSDTAMKPTTGFTRR